LLGDAVVRRLLSDLDLCPANVIYNAGGNFMVLGPQDAEDHARELQGVINQKLLDEFDGDLTLCLASEGVTATELGSEEFADVSWQLKQKIARGKRQRFRKIACDQWEKIYGPQGTGGQRYCAISQKELGEDEAAIPIPDAEAEPDGRAPVMSRQSCGFIGLAEAIGGAESRLMSVSRDEPPPSEINESDDYRLYRSYRLYWRNLLWKVAGGQYDFVKETSEAPEGSHMYTINDTEFLAKGAHGFLFLGNMTPRISAGDIIWFKDTYPHEEPPKREQIIKDFDLMARQAAGIKRVGVLRMDVDDLGRVLIQGLKPRTMVRTSALSQALELFFAGWLNVICQGVQISREMLPEHFQRRATELLYTIYSGGDDLFIVGAWDRIPVLAEHVRHDLAVYAGCNPDIHISGGITLESRRFPLYRAAERAYEALESGAKEYKRPDERKKDALSFLGQTMGWEEWSRPTGEDYGGFRGVPGTVEQLLDLLADGMPRGILLTLQSIYAQYLRDRKRGPEHEAGCQASKQIYYGRWMWLQAYQLSRLIEQYRYRVKDVERRVRELQQGILQPETVCYSGLAARWAEYLTRRED